MYSPKIAESLVKRLYLLAKRKNIAMTKLTNSILENGLLQMELHEEAPSYSVSQNESQKEKEDIKMAV